MIIDAHNHVNWHGHSISACVADMDANGIDVTWALSWEPERDEFDPFYESVFVPGNSGLPFKDVLEAHERYPDRFVMGFCPNPRDPEAVNKLKSAHKFGARVCGEWKYRSQFDDPDNLRIFRCAGELGMPVTLHLDVVMPADARKEGQRAWWYGGTFDAVLRAVEACPETVFLGHAPGFWRYISADAEQDPAFYPKGPVLPGGRLFDAFRKHPNLYADISAGSGATALGRDLDVTRALFQEFPDRIVYGRDCFSREHMDVLERLELPKELQEKVMWRNAARLARMEVEGIVG